MYLAKVGSKLIVNALIEVSLVMKYVCNIALLGPPLKPKSSWEILSWCWTGVKFCPSCRNRNSNFFRNN
ncbi:hypothetical protein NWE59_01345 [Mycoplasmopsis felis]|uniref:hypothetical protein n=1 Tax=Mycoplasmopsis felis TaxID=33923 RepID=UPI0021AFD46A|nr:hypothetical protein [Mycoplasmopsis felis]UWV78747.1 hypothetical protein NWE59_01345 [Mycoplasmopsis felis]